MSLCLARKNKAATKIQSMWRMAKQRRAYLDLIHKVTTLQSFARMAVERRRYLLLQRTALCVQKSFRAKQAQFEMRRCAAVTIQTKVRGFLARKSYIKLKEASVKIQAIWRCWHQRRHYLRLVESTILVQSIVRRNIARKAFLEKRKMIVEVIEFLKHSLD